ncbi:hemolysin family protein [Protaetiibacter larvae]|uniref:HlyC/CorC family transporter n=1 Tax=Protaetiibacter larvae TaxID=2592654 RepID=A0A5C1Y8X7_9MICO|nr:hemolysin family protein [Protaetiibacter larvae]QEO10424.1 HlyC/CorC family transporter [Protaetiibacter larvae]
MSASDWWGIAWLFILLAVNAFFVAAEFAVISARRSQIEPRAEAGSRAAKTALWAMEHATLMLATSQLGITVCSLLILNVSEPAIHHLLAVPLELTGWSAEVVATVAFIVTLVLVSFLHVVFGEMVPKNLSFSVPDRAVLLLATPLVAVATVFRPVIRALNATANGALLLFGVQPKNEATSAFTVEEVETIVRTSTREGVLTDATGTLSNAFEFTTKKVKDVAVGMTELVTLPEDAAPVDVDRAVAQHGFSRYVLVDEGGEPSGYIHLKDVLDLDDDEYGEPVPPKRIRQLISLYREMELEDALTTLRRAGSHVARVFDEHGATRGVLFLEDIIEELVGEVQDATRRE